MTISRRDVETTIDASLGSTPAPTLEEYVAFVKETLKYSFAATLVEPYYIRASAPILHDAGKKLVTVIAYPLAGMTHEAKIYQAKQALKDGADEIDVSMDFSAFKSGDYRRVVEDLTPIVSMAEGRVVKMIYFADALNEEEQIRAAELAQEAGIKFLKTNPGYGYVTTVQQVKLIKAKYGKGLKVMASGGVRTAADAVAMIEAGADRIATSSPFQIIAGLTA